MTEQALKIILESMEELGLNYEFMEWTSEAVYPYFVGEYQETPPADESSEQEATFILTGFSRGSWLQLEQAKNKIKKCFPKASGKIVTTESRSAVAIFYAYSFPVPTGDAELKKIQINLTVKEWSAN